MKRSRRLNKRISDLFPRRKTYSVSCSACGYYATTPSGERPIAWLFDLRDMGCPDCGASLTVENFRRKDKKDACRVCGDPVSGRRRAYCSERCSETAAMVQRMYTWSAVRQNVLERDDYTCQSCGVDVSENGENTPEVDHIQAISDDGHALDERNLRTLCGACHGEKTHGTAMVEGGVSPGDYLESNGGAATFTNITTDYNP